MIKQTIVWTLLPDPAAPRASGGTVQLTLLASPRLTTDTVVPLSDYPDVRHWPAVSLQVAVEIVSPGGAVTVPAEFTDEAPDSTLWQAIFPPSLPVVPFKFDRTFADTPIKSYPAERVRASLADEYRRLFGPDEPGATTHDDAANDDVADAESRWEAIDRLIRVVGDGTRKAVSVGGSQLGAVPDDLHEDPSGWSRLAEFHRSRRGEGHTTKPGLTRDGKPAERDFHAVAAALADHPRLQARLGLVRALRVHLPAGLEGPVTIRAVPSHHAGLSDYRPRTSCVAHAGELRLATKDGAEAPLYLTLDDISRYAAIDVDTDAAGLSLQTFVSSLRLTPRDAPTPPPVHLPALRSDGIFVAEANRAIPFKDALRRAANEIEADLAGGGDGGAIVFNADDVQQGYRVDVLDVDSGRWSPLCRRVGAYKIAGLTSPVPVDDEGTVSDVLTASSQDGAPVNLLHQSLFRWNGWSLVVPPPGRMLDRDGQTVDPNPGPVGNPPFTMEVTVPAGTLPSLRYGRRYRIRARLVDIAGRSLPFNPDPAVPAPATPALQHNRYHPVPSPVLVPRRPVTEGESTAVMVVRTDNSDPANPRPGPPCERHVLPPKAAVLTLERHGVLDVPGEHRLDPNTYALLFERDARGVSGTPDPAASGTPYIDADTITLPWLPDPLADGIAIHGLPGDLQMPWPRGDAWHDRRPVRLIVEPGTGPAPPLIDPVHRTIRLALEPGAGLSTTISSELREGTEEVLGLWQWFAGEVGRATTETAARRHEAVAGRAGQLTPPQELRMIHAVRCPQTPPVFSGPKIVRTPDEAGYELTDPAIGVHAASTASVHVEAEWSDVVDDPTRNEPTHATGRAILKQDHENPPTAATTPFQARAELGDTRHHTVRFTPVATSPFAAYFTQRRTVRLAGTETVRLADALVPGTVVVVGHGTPATFRLDHDIAVDYTAGTIARIPGGGVPDGADLDVAFVTPPVTRAGSPITLSVPASTRPAPPTVHSVVPAFAWRRDRSGSTIISTRYGGLLRVYLERPWFDSGDGELLAVLIADDELRHLNPDTWAQTLPFVSGAGADPTGLGGGAPDLAQATFPRAVRSQTVRVPGLRDIDPAQANNPLFRIKAVGHTVEFDPQRRLWFSDIEIGHDTDQPFVELKLARLQPDTVELITPGAIEDLHISRIVDAGFHQLPTERTAQIELQASVAFITVTGPVHTDLAARISVAVRTTGQGDDPTMWNELDQQHEEWLTAGLSADGAGRWSGFINLPVLSGTRPMQLLLREHRLISGGPGSTAPGERLSYVDVLDL
ncbi:hypothetical protein AB0L06_35250 [Spirillospora sp. NPDC052269]